MEEHGIHVVEEGDSHHIGGLKAAIHNPSMKLSTLYSQRT